MKKLFIVYANCLHPEERIIEIKEDDLKIWLSELMDYSLEDKPEILEVKSLADVRKLMFKNAMEWLESSYGMLECGTYAIYNLDDIRELDQDEIPYLYGLDDLLDCEEVNALEFYRSL